MKNYYFISGLGQSRSKTGALSKALEVSALTRCRSLIHTNILPKGALFLEADQVSSSADIVDAMLATAEGDKGSFISAGIVLGDLCRKGKKEKTIICKQGGVVSEENLKNTLNKELMGFCEEGQEIQNVKFLLKSLQVEEEYGSVLVGIGFTEAFLPAVETVSEYPSFLGKQSSYEKAKYVVVPVFYEYPPQMKRVHAPSAILKASKWMEDYDIETDQQLSSHGVHTAAPLVSIDTPHVFIERMMLRTKELLRDKKFPIFFGEDQTVSIGVMQGIKEVVGDFSVLHFGASTQLRPSFDGSQYSQACAMKKGLEYAKDIVQVGIRTTSNREKRELQYDKIFFAADIFDEPDNHWMEDVIEELSSPSVYITIDASVFDPSVMMSRHPEPMGLTYQQVIKVLKIVSRRKKILGLDLVGLHPQEGGIFSELAAARLIYQFLCYLTKN